jgi:hypothetical protein
MRPDRVCGGLRGRPGPGRQSEIHRAQRAEVEISTESGSAFQEVTVNRTNPAIQRGFSLLQHPLSVENPAADARWCWSFVFSQTFHSIARRLKPSVRKQYLARSPAGFFLPVIKPFLKTLSNRRLLRGCTRACLDFVSFKAFNLAPFGYPFF